MNSKRAIAPFRSRVVAAEDSQYLGSLIRVDYGRCHPDDSFEDLKRRAPFAKEDKGLLRDWLIIAERRVLRAKMIAAA